MGKIKRRKVKSCRYLPTAHIRKDGTLMENAYGFRSNSLGSESPFNENKHDVSFKGKVGLKVAVEKIFSGISEETITGLNIISGFALSDSTAEIIIQDDIIAKVAKLLQDSNLEVRMAAAGTLRNMCINNSQLVVDTMVQQDVLPYLTQLINDCSNNSSIGSSDSAAYKRQISTNVKETDPYNLLFVNAASLLWSLCEFSEEAIDVVNRDGLVAILLKHIDLSVLDCCNTVVLAAAGCLLCISENNPRACSIILPSADWLLSLILQSLNDCHKSVNLQFSITVSDDDEWDDCSEDSSDVDFSDELMEVIDTPMTLPPEVLEGIKCYHLIHKTLHKLSFLNDGSCWHQIRSTELKKLFEQLQIRALQCLHNLVSCLDVEDFGGPDEMYIVWCQLMKTTFTENHNFLEASSGALRSIVDKLASIESTALKLISCSQDDLKPIFEAALSCKEPRVRANVARMMGILGCLIIQNGNDMCSAPSFEILNAMTSVLFKIAEDDPVLWVNAEALDVIIDLYSDDKTDSLSAEVGLLDKLKEIHPQFKVKHKKLKKKLGDQRSLVLTVRDNLVAFIKYKGSRGAVKEK